MSNHGNYASMGDSAKKIHVIENILLRPVMNTNHHDGTEMTDIASEMSYFYGCENAIVPNATTQIDGTTLFLD